MGFAAPPGRHRSGTYRPKAHSQSVYPELRQPRADRQMDSAFAGGLVTAARAAFRGRRNRRGAAGKSLQSDRSFDPNVMHINRLARIPGVLLRRRKGDQVVAGKEALPRYSNALDGHVRGHSRRHAHTDLGAAMALSLGRDCNPAAAASAERGGDSSTKCPPTCGRYRPHFGAFPLAGGAAFRNGYQAMPQARPAPSFDVLPALPSRNGIIANSGPICRRTIRKDIYCAGTARAGGPHRLPGLVICWPTLGEMLKQARRQPQRRRRRKDRAA